MGDMQKIMAGVEAAAAAATGAAPAAQAKEAKTQAELSKMKLDELKAMAAGMGLDATGAEKKADLVQLIVKAQLPGEQPDGPADNDQRDHPDTQPPKDPGNDQPALQEAKGRVLVMYNGMVNLRTIDGEVDGKAMQGQTFPVKGKLELAGVTWYWITDREGQDHLISGQVVRYMQ